MAAGGRAFALSGSVTDEVTGRQSNLRAADMRARLLPCQGFPEAMVAAALARHGALDIVVNNAGVLGQGR